MRTDEDEVHELLRHLDHPMTQVDVRDLMRPPQSVRWSRVGQAAAVLVMFGIAGVAFAAPGSPLSSWIVKVVERAIHGSSIEHVVPPPPVAHVATPSVPTPSKPRISGVAVAPGPKLAIVFANTQSVGDLRVSLVDVAAVTVRTENGAATFTSSEGRLVVSNAGSQASFDIEVPVGAPRIEILVAGALRFVKDGQHISAASASRRGELYIVPLQSSSRNKP